MRENKTPLKQSMETNHYSKRVSESSKKASENLTKNTAHKVSESLKNIVERESVDKAIGNVYKRLKRSVINNSSATDKSQKQKKQSKNDKYRHGYTQDIIPIKSIRNGIIHTKSGMYVNIIEVLPINFYDMPEFERSNIAQTFASFFHNGPSKVHLKCITDRNNPERLINFIKEKCEEEKWQRGISDKTVECAQDVINKIRALSDNSSLTKRYFIIYRYEGRSSDLDDIYNEMYSIRQSITMLFSGTGNTVIDYGQERQSYEAGEILYYCLNRETCRNEPFRARIDRITQDFNIYNSLNNGKKEKIINDTDYIAPKGLYFTNRDYMYVDGQYKTFFILKENGHPGSAEIGWLDNFTSIGDGTELDVYIDRVNHDTTYAVLDQLTHLRIVDSNSKQNNRSKQNKILNAASNTAYIAKAMENGEDLFNVIIIITISASSIRELRALKNLVLKYLNRSKLYVEEAYANTKQFYFATLPLMEASMDILSGNKLFIRNKRNYLTSSLESLYMFTGFEMTDPNGVVLGTNKNHSLVSINTFNTTIFPNANISIFGMTGSGKTYSTQILARAMRVSGIRIFMILPLKAHEYIHGSDAIDGTFISLGPGVKDCINICEIRPKEDIDCDVLKENFKEDSLLAQKITSLIVWLQLNLLDEPMTSIERDMVEKELTSLYYDFGITNDNDSIYDNEGELKLMPIISDIYDRFMDIKELERIAAKLTKYVTGTCSNMNGQTNVDLTGKYICFNVDKKNIPDDLLPSFIYIATDCCYSLIRQSRLYFDYLFIDEIWNLLMHPYAANIIKEMVKIIRGYAGAVAAITQDIDDYINNDCGKAIIAGTAIKIIMYLERPQCVKVAQELGLSERDIDAITHFKRGQAMIVTSKIKVIVDICPSDKEDEEFTTDPNRLRMYAERHRINSKQVL